jgi:hypothetical protein
VVGVVGAGSGVGLGGAGACVGAGGAGFAGADSVGAGSDGAGSPEGGVVGSGVGVGCDGDEGGDDVGCGGCGVDGGGTRRGAVQATVTCSPPGQNVTTADPEPCAGARTVTCWVAPGSRRPWAGLMPSGAPPDARHGTGVDGQPSVMVPVPPAGNVR